MTIRGQDIISVLKQQIEQYSMATTMVDVGSVIEVGDGIARIHGLATARYNELLEKEKDRKKAPSKSREDKQDKGGKGIQTGLLKGLSILQKGVSPLTKKVEPLVKTSKKTPAPDVVPTALSYLNSLKVQEVERFENPKKKSCLDLVVRAPTALGLINYWVKVISKKKLNEGDLSLAYNEGLDRKMPVLVLTNADLTKTAQNYLNTTGSFLKVKKF